METRPRMLIPPLQHPLQLELPRSPPTAGLPTLQTFKAILHSRDFTEARFEDRPISRSKFDEILENCQQSDNRRSLATETRPGCDTLPGNEDLFSISPRPAILFGRDISSYCDSHPRSILTYQSRIVAVEDLLYDILCFCHLASDHGDQDATNALIQENYAFVPFTLVRDFVGSCSICVDSESWEKTIDVMPFQDDCVVDDLKPNWTDKNLVNDTSSDLASTSTPLLPSESSKTELPLAIRVIMADETDHEEEEDFVRYLHLERTLRNPVTKIELPLMSTRSDPGFHPPSTSSPGTIERVTSLPMSREVSLYQGIPNGWQYHFPDYESALNEFVKQKDESFISPIEGVPKKREAVPRVPSIAPLRGDKIQNTLGNGSELFDRQPSTPRKKAAMHETLKDDLLCLALAQIDEFSVSFEGCKENDLQI